MFYSFLFYLMPQFDFFFWFTIAHGTITAFQGLDTFLEYYILVPFAIIQKTLIKLYVLREGLNIKNDIFTEFLSIFYVNNLVKKVAKIKFLLKAPILKHSHSQLLALTDLLKIRVPNNKF